MAERPLQNRVDPFGELHSTPARGTLMGNRGGRFHDDRKELGGRRWAGRRWISCVCEFRGRHREIWSDGYTELFFLDEITALAAGHRPCFECRRSEALDFARAMARGVSGSAPLRADAMDAILDAERRRSRTKRVHMARLDSLPDGAMVAVAGKPFALRGGKLMPWRFTGYGEAVPPADNIEAVLLTPPSATRALAAGYSPRWHTTWLTKT